MKNIFLILLHLLVWSHINSQNITIKTYVGMPVGQQSNFLIYRATPGLPSNTANLDKPPNGLFGALALSLGLKNSDALLEVAFKWNKSTTRDVELLTSGGYEKAGKAQFKSICVPLEYNMRLGQKKHRWQPFLGVTLITAYDVAEFKPDDTKAYYASHNEEIRLQLGVIPRLQYNLNAHCFFDVNSAISLVSFGLESSKVENPALTSEQQKQRNGAVKLSLAAWPRVGVGYNF